MTTTKRLEEWIEEEIEIDCENGRENCEEISCWEKMTRNKLQRYTSKFLI